MNKIIVFFCLVSLVSCSGGTNVKPNEIMTANSASSLKIVPNNQSARQPASELDSWTHRFADLPDATDYLNRKFEEELQKVIKKTNKKYNCQKKRKKAALKLYEYLDDRVGKKLKSRFEYKMEKDSNLPKITTKKQESVFKKLSMIKDWVNFLYLGIGSNMNIDGNFIGIDKLGHYLGFGYQYFKKAYIKNKGIKDALNYGTKQENSWYGKYMTGIFSYGDLVANYEGMLFYRELTNDYYKTNNPYVICENGKWKQVRDFDWGSHLNAGMDEGINCNKLRNEKLEKKIGKEIKKLEDKFGRDLSCPINKNACLNLYNKYGKLSKHLLHPKCIRAAQELRPSEILNQN